MNASQVAVALLVALTFAAVIVVVATWPSEIGCVSIQQADLSAAPTCPREAP